jgi:hypothetical protein
MMEWLTIAFATLLSGNTCNAGVFGYEGDTMSGGPNACTGVKMARDEMGIAHRTLACGTRVVLYNPRTNRSTTAVVVDHGPYGAMDSGRWVLKRRLGDPGVWRGCLDISRAVARKLGFEGFGKLFYAPLAHW